MDLNNVYSNIKFTEIKEILNHEILRRGSYKWWDPLTFPSVGEDRTPPLSLPDIGERRQIDDKTYTINNPSEGSIERTRNIIYEKQGENPAGQLPDRKTSVPNTSASQMNFDEMRNFLVGLSKIQDVNLFYGRDEISHLAFRDPQGIYDAVEAARKNELNRPLMDSDISATKNDPNGGITNQKNSSYTSNHSVTYPIEDGKYVMPSGEYDGEETSVYEGVGITNFYDDYGAEPGDSNFHPYNRYASPNVRRDWHDQDNDRNEVLTIIREGGISSKRFGQNPRNPERGDQFVSRPVYGGVVGSCNVACTGLCYTTCDNECSESCTTTCWNRCGNACTASCGNSCTGCSSWCYSSCRTKCENISGYSCLKSGVKTLEITTKGGFNGEPAQNLISYSSHSCNGCSYSCQFYPNKKTECWDSGCMGKCYNSCSFSCSTSCYGGCINNDSEEGTNFKTGKGRGCSSGCTMNCIGFCSGVCEGYCIQTCWKTCKGSCADNCSWSCETICGHGCENGCSKECAGCTSCAGSCYAESSSRGCTGCGIEGGCTSSCQHDCNKNCIGWGCKSICGVEGQGACEANCRLNCMNSSCTAMCSDACSSGCTTCVNTCGFQCGACSSICSTGCSADCNITCSRRCEHSCDLNCVHSCSEECGGCSDLCYSCVGMCIGICSVRCENGCSSCTNTCGWWCDAVCSRACSSNCSDRCISNCSGSCATFLESSTKMTSGPERKPTAQGYIYPNPKNRWEERESFKLFRDVPPYKKPERVPKLITIQIDDEKNIEVIRPEGLEYITYATSVVSGVYNIDTETGEIIINSDMLDGLVHVNKPNLKDGHQMFIVQLLKNDDIKYTNDDIEVILPFEFEYLGPIKDKNDNTIVIIQRDLFLFPWEVNNGQDNGSTVSGDRF